ncbi:MAG: DUF58 domain-containing protein [Bryobacteraceae bacterium]
MRVVPTQRLVLAAGIILVPLGAIAGVMPQLLVVCAVAALAFLVVGVLDAVSGMRRPSTVRVDLPDSLRWTMDEREDLSFQVSAPTRVRVAPLFPECIEPDCESSEASSQVIITCVARERGDFLIDLVYVEAVSILGFWSARTARPANCLIRVYPNLRRDPGSAQLLKRSLTGVHMQRQVGRGRDFEKLREYQPGDSFDEIHWKSTAKRRRPIVKVFQIERTQEVYAVIDSSRLSARDRALEESVRAALLLGAVTEKQGDLFGLITFSEQVDTFVRARKGKQHFHRCREAIYKLQPRLVSPNFDELFAFIQVQLRRRALLIFITALDDALLAETFAQHVELISRQHVVLVNAWQPPEARPLFTGELPSNEEQIYHRLGGHIAWQKVLQLRKALEKRGVRLAFLQPDQASVQLATGYLEAKRRQVL